MKIVMTRLIICGLGEGNNLTLTCQAVSGGRHSFPKEFAPLHNWYTKLPISSKTLFSLDFSPSPHITPTLNSRVKN